MFRKLLAELGAARTSLIITTISILSSVFLYAIIGKFLGRIEAIGILLSITIPAIVAPLLSYFLLRLLIKLDLAEKALAEANKKLGFKIEQRKTELVAANEELQAEVAEHKPAEEGLQRRLDHLTSLSQASQAVTTSLELDQVLAEIVSLASEVVASDYAGVVLVDEEGKLSQSAECLPGMPAVDHHIRDKGFTHWIVHSRQVVVVDDIDENGTVSPKPANGAPCTANPLVVKAGVKSFVGLPLVVKDHLLGVLYLRSLRPGHFSDRLPLLNAFANQAAIAIENARLYQAERKRATQLVVVSKVAQRAASILDLDQFLQEVVVAIQQGFNYYNVTIDLLDETTGELEPVAVAGHFADKIPASYRQAVGVGMVGWAAKTGQSLLANDVRQELHYIPGFVEEPLTKSELSVPLKLAGQVLGVLDVEDTRLNAFDETDLLAMETLADQITMAIENARLFKETKHRFEATMALYQISLDITAQLEMTESLKSIIERAVILLRAEAGGIYLYDSERGELGLAIGYDYVKKYVGVTLKPGEGMAGKVFQTGEPLIVDDYRAWEGRAQVYEADQPFTAVLDVPLKWRENIIGVLSIIANVQERAFNQDDIWLATLFANQVAVAIENARLFEAEARRRQEAETLHQAAMALTSTLDLEEALGRILEQLHRVVAYDSASVQLLRDNYLEIVGGRGFADPSAVIGLRFPVPGDNPNTRVIKSGEPVILADARTAHAPFRESPHDHIRSWLGVPVRFRERIIGLITLDSTELGHFTADHARLATAFANQAAVAIENARLYEQITSLAVELEARVQERTKELSRKTRELSSLYYTSLALSSSLEVEEVLETLARQAALVADAVGCIIYKLQDDTLVTVAGYQDSTLPGKDLEIGRRYLLADYPATREAVEKGQPLWVRVDDPLAGGTERAGIRASGYTALLQIQIMSRDQVMGVVEIFDSKPGREFSESDAALLQTIANQAGMAIERAHLFQQVREERNHLELLYEVSRKLSASLDLGQALYDIFQVSAAAAGTKWGSIFIFDDEGQISHRILARSISPAGADDFIGRVLREGLAGWVLEHKQPTIVFDTNQDERWLHFPEDIEPAGSAMAIPFIEYGRVRGLLTLEHSQPYHFNQTHLELFSSIARQVAVVIERARLYEETRHRAQELAQQKEQTDAIVQSMADGLIVTDLENKLILANPAAEELLKFKLEDAIGQEIGANIRDDRLRQTVRDTLDKQQAGYEVDIELADSHSTDRRIIRAHTAVVNDLFGQPIGIVTTLREVTHEREVQQLKDDLVSTISHELRTPMASVLGFSELLLTRQLSGEKRQLYTQTIHEEAQRLSELINNFLDIQRIEKGKLEYHLEEMKLGDLVHEMVTTHSAQSNMHTLIVDLPSDLPLVQADPDRLRQVFGNLLSNAVKFSPDGGTVVVSAQVRDNEILIAVSDEGIGVPAEALPHIFERFFRVDSSDRRKIKGTGLGLAICKEIVEAHGGRIWAESQEGVGTTIIFSLPLLTRKRILIVDDEQDIREMFQRLLSEKGYEVLVANNGQKGLSLMEELPDLVILDIAMPVMNGYQFLEKVKEDQRMTDIPVIVISGFDTDIKRLKELKVDEFLSKPFSSTVLLDTIQRLLERSWARVRPVTKR